MAHLKDLPIDEDAWPYSKSALSVAIDRHGHVNLRSGLEKFCAMCVGDDVVTTIRRTIPPVNRAHLESRGEHGIACGGSKRWFVTLRPERVGSILVRGIPWGCIHFYETYVDVEEHVSIVHYCVVRTLWVMFLGRIDMHKLTRCSGCPVTEVKWSPFLCEFSASIPKPWHEAVSVGLYNEYKISQRNWKLQRRRLWNENPVLMKLYRKLGIQLDTTL